MVADEQLTIAENSDIATGEMDFVMDRGRDHWNCNCEKYAEQNPWKVDDPDRPDIPVHPNCMCEWRPRLKTDEEILAAFKEEMAEDLVTIQGTDEQQAMMDAIDVADTGSFNLDEKIFTGGPNMGKSKYEKLHISSDIDAYSTDKSMTESEKRVILTNSAENIFKDFGMNITKGEPMIISKASSGTNPNYDPYKEIADPYNQNCQRCVTTYIMRRLGFDVEAMPFPETDNKIASGLEAFMRPNGSNAYATNPMGLKKLKEEMGQRPDGTMFIVSGRVVGEPQGHTWVAEKIKGKLYFIDPQSNETDVSYYLSHYKELRYFPVDMYVFNSNSEFDWNSLLKAVK